MSSIVQPVTSGSTLLAAAKKAAQANGAASSSSSSGATSASGTASSALSSLTSNFNSFLTLLTTQLQNQDPSSPMDSSTFTSEIATYAGVQQSVNTNTNLGTLISLTQNGQVSTDSSLVGETARYTGNQIALQSGSSSISFTTPSSEPIAIAISNANGAVVRTVQGTSDVGSNNWTWDGKDDSGNTLSDGTYGIAVETQDGAGNDIPVSFNGNGIVTGVTKSSSGDVLLQLGTLNVNSSAISSFSKAGA